jgi:hypothetical protein
LDASTRAFFEPRFGRDFSQVRVRTGPRAAESARAIHAQAYTLGRHIAFDDGNYAPQTIQGSKLLAHELTHVVQQSGGMAMLQRKTGGTARPTYAFSVTTPGCDQAPFAKVTVEHAAKKAFEKVRDTDCIKFTSLREDVLAEFDGLSIECKQGISKTNKDACAEAPGDPFDVSLYGSGFRLQAARWRASLSMKWFIAWRRLSSRDTDTLPMRAGSPVFRVPAWAEAIRQGARSKRV